MSDQSWYNVGYEGVKKEAERIANGGSVERLFIPPGTEREIIFLDDSPFSIYEHNPKMNGSFKNWMTCLKGIHEDVPCCEILGLKTRYLVGYYTVIDCTKYVSSNGNTYQYEVKLLPAKFTSLKLLERKTKSGNGLAGKLFKVFRTDEKSPVIGNEYEFQRDVDLTKVFSVANVMGKKLPELYAKAAKEPESMERLKNLFQLKFDANNALVEVPVPFNYMKKLAPQDAKDIYILLKGAKIESYDDRKKDTATGAAATGSHADEEVPF